MLFSVCVLTCCVGLDMYLECPFDNLSRFTTFPSQPCENFFLFHEEVQLIGSWFLRVGSTG